MKKTAIPTFLLSLLIIVNLSCAKNDHTWEKEVDVDNLSSCPSNKTCQYSFAENVDIDKYYKMNAGSHLLFWASEKADGNERLFYIKTPMTKADFELGKAEIIRGDVKYLNICPACNTIALKAVDGYVKGINLAPGKQPDQTKWLLDMRIFLQSEDGEGPIQVVTLKQIYYPKLR